MNQILHVLSVGKKLILYVWILIGVLLILSFVVTSIPEGFLFFLCFLYAIPIWAYYKIKFKPVKVDDRPYKADWAQLSDVRDMLCRIDDKETEDYILIASPPKIEDAKSIRNMFYALKPHALGRKEMGNVLLTALPRSGKGLHVTSVLLTWGGSAIVTDLKGEFHNTSSGWRAANGHKIVILNPTEENGNYNGHTFDPIVGITEDEDELSAMADIIIEPDRDKGNSIFGETAIPALIAMMRAAKLEGMPTFDYIALCLRELGMQQSCVRMWNLQDGTGIIRANLVTFLSKPVPSAKEVDWGEGKSPSLASQAWKNLTTRLRPLLSSGPRAMMSGNDLRVSDLWERPTTVYLVCPESRVEVLRPVLRLVMRALVQAYLKEADAHPDAKRQRLLLALDETGRVPLPGLPSLVSTASGRGVSVLTYVQDLAQLENAYGRAGAFEVAAGSHTRVYWPTSSPETAQRIGTEVGAYSARQGQTSLTTSVEPGLFSTTRTSTTESESWTTRPLITPDEVRQLPIENVIVVSDNRPPFGARRIEWFNYPQLLERARMKPAKIPSRKTNRAGKSEEIAISIHSNMQGKTPYFGDDG